MYSACMRAAGRRLPPSASLASVPTHGSSKKELTQSMRDRMTNPCTLAQTLAGAPSCSGCTLAWTDPQAISACTKLSGCAIGKKDVITCQWCASTKATQVHAPMPRRVN